MSMPSTSSKPPSSLSKSSSALCRPLNWGAEEHAGRLKGVAGYNAIGAGTTAESLLRPKLTVEERWEEGGVACSLGDGVMTRSCGGGESEREIGGVLASDL